MMENARDDNMYFRELALVQLLDFTNATHFPITHTLPIGLEQIAEEVLENVRDNQR
jgi:hypothetical protein